MGRANIKAVGLCALQHIRVKHNLRVVEPVGFEPATFPMQSGRSPALTIEPQHSEHVIRVLPGFYLLFSLSSFGQSGIRFGIS